MGRAPLCRDWSKSTLRDALPFPRDAGRKGLLCGTVGRSVQIRILLSNGKQTTPRGLLRRRARSRDTREVSSGADSTITIVSLGRIERLNLALLRSSGRFPRRRDTNQPTIAAPSAKPARIRAISSVEAGPIRSQSRQSRKAPTTRPIMAEIASLASDRHAALAQLSARRRTQQRRPAESVAAQISQHSPPGLRSLEDGDKNRAGDFGPRKYHIEDRSMGEDSERRPDRPTLPPVPLLAKCARTQLKA